ncbi:hypothetical protein NPIL_225411 [Nephila pilipes]|uniref:Uncharacterized protein n=1 Tax=Nephila pilipes TaxID=299642 RepID=A0A8X6TND2_NEPPI|nr:hypothetical protein NPIL_225411 [Nephila pilipes]
MSVKTLYRHLKLASDIPIRCPLCNEPMTVHHFYHHHALENHRLQSRKQCLFCKGEARWAYGEKNRPDNVKHVVECLKRFVIIANETYVLSPKQQNVMNQIKETKMAQEALWKCKEAEGKAERDVLIMERDALKTKEMELKMERDVLKTKEYELKREKNMLKTERDVIKTERVGLLTENARLRRALRDLAQMISDVITRFLTSWLIVTIGVFSKRNPVFRSCFLQIPSSRDRSRVRVFGEGAESERVGGRELKGTGLERGKGLENGERTQMRVWGETLEARTDPRNLLNPWKIRNKNPWDTLGKGETGSIGERDTEGETWAEEERQKNRTTISQKKEHNRIKSTGNTR